MLALGETIVDFIATEQTEDGLRNAITFQRYLGGSPANIAVYVAKLGGKAATVSKTGIGAFGQFLKSELRYHGVITDYFVMDHRVHTTIIFVSRTSGTPDFEAFRDGDYKLTPEEVTEEAIAHSQDKIVSLDPNYSPQIWPDHQEAEEVYRQMFRYATITKPSLDDAQRFFGPDHTPEEYIQMYHQLGPQTVIFTMGQEGILISHDGKILGHIPVRPIEVVDVTGAGDSFWAGFLVALLDGHSLERCALFAREIVELKLTTVGPLPSTIDRAEIYAKLPESV